MAGTIGNFIKHRLFKTEERKALGIAYFYLMGIIFHALPFTRPLVVRFTPVFLLIAGGFVFYYVLREKNRSLLIWCAAAYIFTTVIEIIGVKTGAVFGPYSYGTVLGPKLMGAPLIIGFNWLLVILGLCHFSGKITSSVLLASGIVGTGAFVFDFFLEPIAIRLNYWTWHASAVPIRNYIAWFVIAFCAGVVYHLIKMKTDTKLPVYYLGIQLCFFIVLRFIV